jgi:hypothetical protein
MELIRDKQGRLTGVIREIAGGRERLYTPQGEAIADYSPETDLTYDIQCARFLRRRFFWLAKQDEYWAPPRSRPTRTTLSVRCALVRVI